MDGLSDVVLDWTSSSDDATGEGVLAPGETVQASATYVVTQADVDRGEIVNTATASGVDPTNATTTGSDTATVELTRTSSYELDKIVESVSGSGLAGDTVTYAFTLENTGTTTLTGVTIVDEMAGLSPIDVEWTDGDGVLLPGSDPVVGTATSPRHSPAGVTVAL